MNRQTLQELHQWARGKPRPLACLAPLCAFIAQPLHHLFASQGGRELLDECAHRTPRWGDYYQSDTTLLADLPAEFLNVDKETQRQMASGDLTAALDPAEAVILPFLKPCHQRDYLERAAGITDESVDDTLVMLAGDDTARDLGDVELELFLENQGVRFLIRLVVPCFILHRETPQGMSSSATKAEEPDLDRLGALLRLDPGLIRSDAVEPVLFGRDTRQSAERLQLVGPSLGADIESPELRTVKRRMAGFVSYLSHFLGSPLWGREVRKLFDIRARHTSPACLHDPDLPDTPQHLQKTLMRERVRWEEHFTPDNNLIAAVRALYAPAA